MHSVFAFGCRDDTFGLPLNPTAGTEKRREPDPAEIVTYTPTEVLAIADAARRGAHHDLIRMTVGEEEQEIRRIEDGQDAALILVAAFCGLRMGELLALRWRHVIWHAQRLHIQRAYALGEEDSPKGRRGRTVPLADQPAQALAQLSQRGMFTRNADLVFCSRTGEHLDGSALRRRFKAARDAAIAENPDMPALRFHDLRHTFGTLAAQGFDLVNVQAMMGHADSRTTARYLHARPAAEDAAKLSRIFSQEVSSAIAGDVSVTS
jgi:integrase